MTKRKRKPRSVLQVRADEVLVKQVHDAAEFVGVSISDFIRGSIFLEIARVALIRSGAAPKSDG